MQSFTLWWRRQQLALQAAGSGPKQFPGTWVVRSLRLWGAVPGLPRDVCCRLPEQRDWPGEPEKEVQGLEVSS